MNTVYTQPDMVGMPTCRIEFEAIDGDVLILRLPCKQLGRCS